MATGSNLMGVGMPAPLALRIGGSGPHTITAGSGTQTATTPIGGKQFVVFINGPAGGGSLRLPSMGGSDNAAEIADNFMIHNGTAGSVTVYAPLNATVNIGGSAFSGNTGFVLTTLRTLEYIPISTVIGFGSAG